MDGQHKTAGAESVLQTPNPSGPCSAAAEPEAATPSRLPGAESAGSGSGTRAPGPAAERAAEVWPGIEEMPESQALDVQEAHTSAPQAAERACNAARGRSHAPGALEPEQQNAALPAFASAANRALNDAVRELEAQVIATLKTSQAPASFVHRVERAGVHHTECAYDGAATH